MKKVFVIFVLCFCDSLIFAELSKEQLWAIALTGIMTERNECNHNTLESNERNTRNRNTWRNTLSRDWDVHNKEELLETLETMENDGHAASLKFVQNIVRDTLQENASFSIMAMYNQYRLSSRQYNYLKFLIPNWDLFNSRTILAWDLGRNIALCRWGYDAGFLTEQEAWTKIMYYAKKIQPLYQSWEEYGFDYYMGRVFWASGFGEDINYLLETDPIYRKLTGESGYWHNLEWNIDLGN
jgi:hypothetical protein